MGLEPVGTRTKRFRQAPTVGKTTRRGWRGGLQGIGLLTTGGRSASVEQPNVKKRWGHHTRAARPDTVVTHTSSLPERCLGGLGILDPGRSIRRRPLCKRAVRPYSAGALSSCRGSAAPVTSEPLTTMACTLPSSPLSLIACFLRSKDLFVSEGISASTFRESGVHW